MIDMEPTYCTPDEVAETLDLPSDPDDNYGYFTFTDMTHPSYKQVCRMICSNEDIIDRRLKRSWRVNYVKDRTLNIPKYWQDENAWRMEYYRQGGNYVQLRKDILPWDPTPVCKEESETWYVEDIKKLAVGRVGIHNGKEYFIDEIGVRDAEGKIPITGREVIYRDKLLVRTHNNIWYDMSWQNIDQDTMIGEDSDSDSIWTFDNLLAADVLNNTFWIDRPNGRLFIKRRVYMPAAQAMKISYRWGAPPDELPPAINRLACIMTAAQVLNMQAYNVRLGTGGDISKIKEAMLTGWKEEENTIYASYQRPGSVYSLMR